MALIIWEITRMAYLNIFELKCFVNGALSDNYRLNGGVPLGRILGPLLFLLFINDLPNCLSSSHPSMYADDTHLTFANNEINVI